MPLEMLWFTNALCENAIFDKSGRCSDLLKNSAIVRNKLQLLGEEANLN
jgi:hypothetical protein